MDFKDYRRCLIELKKRLMDMQTVSGYLLLAIIYWIIPVTSNATPSTTFFTPCTPYIQPFAVPHITYDSYFAGSGDFPTDVGLTLGVLPFDKVQAELGFDLFLPGSYPVQLNGKIGIPENAFSRWFPGISAGIFGVGFKNNVNNYNILHFNIGKAIPYLGSIGGGFYKGLNSSLLLNGNGDKEDIGFMVSYYRTLEPLTDRIAIAADWMSGKNVFGGGGVGLYFWFTKSIDLITGWVWFNDTRINNFQDGIFTIQLDIDFNFKRKLEG